MSTATERIGLQSLLALGQSRRPWDYLRAVAKADADAAGAPPVRFLLAANLGSLGFADAALDLLDGLDRDGNHGLGTGALRSALGGALAGRSSTLVTHAPGPFWMTTDGACLWRESGRLIGCDAGREADRVLEAAGLVPGRVPDTHLPPLLIAGMSTPVLLQRAIEATPALTNGYTPRIIVVEPDTGRAERALGAMDAAIDPQRIAILSGEGALDRLAEDLASRLDCTLPRTVLRDPMAPDELHDAVGSLLRDTASEQKRQTDLALGEATRCLQPAESAAARVRDGGSLRVLLPVSRHSSFVHHSAEDLRAALERLGHRVRTLDEPDAHSTLSKLGYLRAAIETDPDLILLINHPRWRLGDALPPGPVSVCWVQDAMPHLFQDAQKNQGEYDFFAGYRFPELVERFGYRADRTIDAVLPVSTTKFHRGPVDPALRERFTCDVAFATRQSETPEAMRDRLRAESSGASATIAVIDHLYEALRERICADEFPFTHRISFELAREALRAAGHAGAGPKAVDEVYRLVLMPLADRIVRDVVTHRAAVICERRGWSLALYGRGWEHHPTLAQYARGELTHGEELRAAYHCAGVHLHASAHSLIHQRSIECLFSGGRILSYRRRIDAGFVRSHTLGTLLRTGEPDRIDPDGAFCYGAGTHPELGAYLNTLDRIGTSDPWRCAGEIRVPADRIQTLRTVAARASESGVARLTHLVLDRCSFDDEDSLEASLEAVLNRSHDADGYDHQTLLRAAQENYAIDRVVARTLQSLREAISGSAE